MNKSTIAKGFSKSIETYSESAIVQRNVSQTLAVQIDKFITAPPKNILEIGCGTGFLTSNLLHRYSDANFILNDINPLAFNEMDKLFKANNKAMVFIHGDAETASFTQKTDLMASTSVFQWFTNLPMFLGNAAKNINPNGLFAFSTFGPQNLKELNSMGIKGLPYFSLEEITLMLSANYHVLEAVEEHQTLYFENSIEVLRHIKESGVNGSFRCHWTRANLNEFTNNYNALKTSNGFPLTYHPLYFICTPKTTCNANSL